MSSRHRRRVRRPASLVERVEPRVLLSGTGTVSGTVFADPRQTGTPVGNAGVPDRVVYVDLAGDGVYSAGTLTAGGAGLTGGDPSAVTDADGHYTITGVPAGTYAVRQVLPADIGQTVPTNFAQRATVTAGNVAAQDFGDLQLTSAGIGATASGTLPLADLGVATQAVTTEPDGKLVVGGAGGTVARFFPDGTADESFGDGGAFAGSSSNGLAGVTLSAVLAQPDGKLDVAGNDASQGYTAQLNPDGTLVAGSVHAFPPDPYLLNPQDASYAALSVAGLTLLASGDVVVVATVNVAGLGDQNTSLATAINPATGAVDATFGTQGNGIVSAAYNNDEAVARVGALALPGGGVEVLLYDQVGNGLSTTDGNFAVHRVAADGTQSDPSAVASALDAQGFTGTLNLGLDGAGRLYAIDTDLATQTGTIQDDLSLAVARFTAGGAIDAGYGSAGTAGVDLNVSGDLYSEDVIGSATVQPDGTAVVVLTTDHLQTYPFSPAGAVLTGAVSVPTTATGSFNAISGLPFTTTATSSATPAGTAAPAVPDTAAGFSNTSFPQPAVVYGTTAAETSVETTAPTAALTALSTTAVTTAGSTAPVLVRVEFSDPVAINLRTLRTGNLLVHLPGSLGTEPATFLGVRAGTAQDLEAVYAVPAYGGAWDVADNGTYTVDLVANQVTNGAVSAAAVAGLATFAVNVSTAPTAVLATVPAVTAAGTASVSLAVTYTGGTAAIAASTIGTDDLSVTGPGGTVLQVTSATPGAATGNALPVTYTVAAPAGGFATANNGAYTVQLNAGRVTDTANAPAAGGTLGTFTVNVPTPDTTAPTASISAVPTVTAAGTASIAVTVTYADATAVKLSTIGTADLTITGPAGTLAVTAATTAATADAASIAVTYTVAAPAGGFTAAANGTYAVALTTGAVTDLAGNAAAAGPLGTFAVAIGAPSAVLATVPPLTAAGVGAFPITVTYTDALRAVLAASIDVNDLTLTGPAGVYPLSVTVATVAATTGNGVTALYTVAAPAPGFTVAFDGTYTVALAGGQVTDAAGVAAPAATLGTFAVAIPVPDATPPSATLTAAPAVTAAGTASVAITVTYADATAVRLSTIGTDDLTVTGPTGTPLVVTAATPSAYGRRRPGLPSPTPSSGRSPLPITARTPSPLPAAA